MIKRVCIFGNSHLAALLGARSENPEKWDDIDLTFVGAHQDRLLQTKHDDGKLVPTTDEARTAFTKFGGVHSVDLNSFDALIIVGCWLSATRSAFLHREARFVGLPSVEASEDLATMGPVLMSRPAFEATLAHIVSRSLGGQFATHLRDGTDKPILFAAQPRSSGRLMDSSEGKNMIQKAAIRSGDGPMLSATYDKVAERMLSAHQVRYLPQPPKTILRGLLTKRAYTKGAVRMSAKGQFPQPETDVIHANAKYGALVMDQISDAVAKV